MTCPFCGESQGSTRPQSISFLCGTWATHGLFGASYDRAKDCLAREVARLRASVAELRGEAITWRDYAEGLEESGDAMKEGATTREQIAWDRQIKRRPSE